MAWWGWLALGLYGASVFLASAVVLADTRRRYEEESFLVALLIGLVWPLVVLLLLFLRALGATAAWVHRAMGWR